MEQAAAKSRFDARWLRGRRFLRTGTAIMGDAVTWAYESIAHPKFKEAFIRAQATAALMDGHPMETAA